MKTSKAQQRNKLGRIKEQKLGWLVWFWLFVNALTGITAAMELFYYGLRDTTATYTNLFLSILLIVTYIIMDGDLVCPEKMGRSVEVGV
ncbi:uncharacterized protein LOC112192806 isoform X2 [Rosa chinensis]|uniref:uncharacterized protein LOC112192806 isoform X2 n=1 Tax=Rosa chinensis TaxID=74649 RepID=UPI000D08C069|nr:uncharacterized protein LOC112192806 isoform X2 [Rosa chinensis]XP_024188449.1 uncharacterized protein LOC112192806 isoform X2 [Rosa chinensis]